MNLIEILSLMGGLMTMSAPMMQAWQTIRTRNVEGLSSTSYLLLLCLGVFSVLIGVQYRVVTMTTLNAIGSLANIAIMFLISRRILFAFYGGLAIVAGAIWLIQPWILETLVTTRWAEPVGFVYGLVAAASFLPQVLMTRNTRSVDSLSLPYLVLFVGGMLIWLVVCVLLGNYSLIFWNGCLTLMVAELLRLKLTIGRRGPAPAATAAPEVPTPAPII